MAGNKEFNTDVEIKGKINLKDVPNNTPTGYLVWNSEIKNIAQRTSAQLINDLGLITANNIASNYYTKTESDTKFIPYTGATKNVNLGDKNLSFTEGSISKLSNGVQIFKNVYQKNSIATTGILSLSFPAPNSSATMFDVTIKIYGYSARILGEIRVSFYKYTNTVINASGHKCIITSTDNFPTEVVKVGIKSDGRICINIGELTTSWNSYTNVRVDEVTATYSGMSADWSQGWDSSTPDQIELDGYSSLLSIPTEIVASKSWSNLTYEPKFTKNTAFNKNFGAIAGTVAQGNHTHIDLVTLGTAQTISGIKEFDNGFTVNGYKYYSDSTKNLLVSGSNNFNNNYANIVDVAIGVGKDIFPSFNVQPYKGAGQGEDWNNKGYVGVGAYLFPDYTGNTNYRPAHNAHDSWVAFGRRLGAGFLDGTNITMMGTDNMHRNDVKYADSVTVIGKGNSNGITSNGVALSPNRVVTSVNGTNIRNIMDAVTIVGSENWFEDISNSVIVGSNTRAYSYAFNSVVIGNNNTNYEPNMSEAQKKQCLDSDVLIGSVCYKSLNRHAPSHNLLIGMEYFYGTGTPNSSYRPLIEGRFKGVSPTESASLQVNGVLIAGHEKKDTDSPNEEDVPLSPESSMDKSVTYKPSEKAFVFDGTKVTTSFKIGAIAASNDYMYCMEMYASPHTAGSWGYSINGHVDSGNTVAMNFTAKRVFVASIPSDFILTTDGNFNGTIRIKLVRTLLEGECVLPNLKFKDSEENDTVEFRGGKLDNSHLSIGLNAGKFLYLGTDTLVIGNGAYSKTTSGYFSTIIGTNAAKNNYSSRYDVIVGYNTLENAPLGSGSNALIGANIIRNPLERIINTTAVGLSALEFLERGSSNSTIGRGSGGRLTVGSDNLLGGDSAGLFKFGNRNTFLGTLSGGYGLLNATIDDTIVIGYLSVPESLSGNTTTIAKPTNTDNFLYGTTHSHAFKVRGGTGLNVLLDDGTVKPIDSFNSGGDVSSKVDKTTQIIAGNGLSGGGDLSTNRTITLGTPAALTAATASAVTATSHTHAITATAIGAVNTIVKTDALGAIGTSRYGRYGVYNAAQTQGIWGMGSAYLVNGTTTGLGTLYGLGYSFISVGGSSLASKHQIHFANAGAATVTVNLSDGEVRANKFTVVGGSAQDFLKADGSLSNAVAKVMNSNTNGDNVNWNTLTYTDDALTIQPIHSPNFTGVTNSPSSGSYGTVITLPGAFTGTTFGHQLALFYAGGMAIRSSNASSAFTEGWITFWDNKNLKPVTLDTDQIITARKIFGGGPGNTYSTSGLEIRQSNTNLMPALGFHHPNNGYGGTIGLNSSTFEFKNAVNVFTPIAASAFYESSLREFKTNIKTYKRSGLELINGLEIVTFDRKDSELKDKIGVIADDTSEEFLSENKDAVDLYKTIFIQAKAIQELSKELKSLRELIL